MDSDNYLDRWNGKRENLGAISVFVDPPTWRVYLVHERAAKMDEDIRGLGKYLARRATESVRWSSGRRDAGAVFRLN